MNAALVATVLVLGAAAALIAGLYRYRLHLEDAPVLEQKRAAWKRKQKESDIMAERPVDKFP